MNQIGRAGTGQTQGKGGKSNANEVGERKGKNEGEKKGTRKKRKRKKKRQKRTRTGIQPYERRCHGMNRRINRNTTKRRRDGCELAGSRKGEKRGDTGTHGGREGTEERE